MAANAQDPFEAALDLLQPVAQEAESRAIRYRKVEILPYRGKAKTEYPLARPGSITIFLAKTASPLLQRVRVCAVSSSGRDELHAEITKRLSSRKQMPFVEATKLLQDQDVFADIRYSGHTVASNLFAPEDAGICVVGLPYNGGKLDPEGLTLVERYRESSQESLDAVAIVHAPTLSKIEKNALKLVPDNMLEVNVGKARRCYAITAVTVTATVITVTSLCRHKPEDELNLKKAVDRIAGLGPISSARELLQVRRSILQGEPLRG